MLTASLIRSISVLPVFLAALALARAEEAASVVRRPGEPVFSGKAFADLVLTGIVRHGKGTDFFLWSPLLRRSIGVRLGETKEGVTAVAFEAGRLQLEAGGVRRALPLGSGLGASAGSPVAEERAREREAVWFVQSLLELQMETRARARGEQAKTAGR